MYALSRLGETQWYDLARARLGVVGPLHQIDLASLLGAAGQADAWPVLVSAARENRSGVRARALRDMAVFDGIVGLDGRAIDVVAELEALRIEFPEAGARITETIEQVRQRREYGRPLSPLRLVGPDRLQALAEAGYRSDDAFSLIRALSEADLPVRETAATVLAGVPAEPAVIGALQGAAQSGEDELAIRAMRSLLIHRATGWDEAAVARLATMDRGEVRIPTALLERRIALAGILAQAGWAEGWPIITEALAETSFAPFLAVREVPHFDGLTDRDGKVIDAAAVLRAQRTRDPEGGIFSGEVNAALRQVETKRGGRLR